ncbi:MAG: slipin family protein [Nitrospirae bacterium]|nr:slipin family protein [Nitrospirota bacterium]
MQNLLTSLPTAVFLLVALIYFLASAIKILREYERGVIFTVGKVSPKTAGFLRGVKGPGIVILIPFVQKMVRVPLRTVTLEVPPQDIITRENVSVKVNAVVFFRVIDPRRATLEVEDYYHFTSQFALTTLRSILGQSHLDDLLAKREEINSELQKIIDQQTAPYGVKVSAVEVKNVDLPSDMQRVIAKQAEAERIRRAKIINAEGEYQAAQKLYEAARIIAQEPTALQLRFLQTLVEVATERNSTTIFPVPIDLLEPFIRRRREEKEKAG